MAEAQQAVDATDDAYGPEVLSAEKWRILLAEDNKTNQLVFTKFMKAFDLEITIVDDGRRAVEKFKSQRFDLILMDINMPEMDGIEATKRIRAQERLSRRNPTPILALTANSMVHQVAEYLDVGMDGHLSKPLKKNNLILEMARALSAGREKSADITASLGVAI